MILNCIKKIISALLSALLIFEPFVANRILYTAIANTLPYAAPAAAIASIFNSPEALAQYPAGVAEGRFMGGEILNKSMQPGALPTMSADRSSITLPGAKNADGTAVTFGSTNIIQKRNEFEGDQPPVEGAFGNETVYDGLVVDITNRVVSESSNQGEVTRTMYDSKRRRVDYSDANFLSRSKTVFEAPFTGCTQTQTAIASAKPYDLSEEKVCTRVVNTLQNCQVERLYTIHPWPVGGEASVLDNTTQFTKIVTPNRLPDGYREFIATVSVDWAKVSKATITELNCDDDCRVEVSGNGGPWIPVPNSSTWGTDFTGPGCREQKMTTMQVPNAVPSIDITSYIQGQSNVQIKLVHCVGGEGEGTTTVKWDLSTPLYEDRGFIQTPNGCWNTQFASEFCHANAWTCADDTPKTAGGLPINIDVIKSSGGKAIWSDNTPYENTAFEETAACWKANATGLCDFNVGPIDCFVDVQGNTQCPVNDGTAEQNSCELLEQEGCVFDREVCVDGAFDAATNTCLAYSSIYKCGTQTVNLGGDVTTEMTYNCAATRCMGTECTKDSGEKNTSFGQVNALLGNLNTVGQDGECDETGCKLFKGAPLECKTALGGLFDCCNQNIQGVNWMDYMKTGYATYKAAQMSGWVAEMPSITGVLTELATTAASTVSSLLSSAAVAPLEAAAVGSATATTSGISAAFAGLQQEVMQAAAKFVGEVFGPAVESAIFSTTTTGGVTTTTLGGSGTLLGSMMTVFMWVYVVYLVLSIVFACEEPEFELAAKKQMKACHYVGTYCSSRALGVCYEVRQSWCCYSSALARIIQEQARLQILGWGTPEDPKCDALSPADIQAIDWERVDLSEYIAMETLAGIKPESGEEDEYYRMENLTKVNNGGDALSVERGNNSPGINTVEAMEKLKGASTQTMDNTRSNAVQIHTGTWPSPPTGTNN